MFIPKRHKKIRIKLLYLKQNQPWTFMKNTINKNMLIKSPNEEKKAEE